jgi:hypothetical protein
MALSPVSFYGASQGPIGGRGRSDYALDPRRLMALELMKNGSSTAPVQSPLEGLAKALQAGVGGYFAREARTDQDNRDAAQSGAMAKVLAGGSAQPWTNPDTGQQQGTAGGIDGMMAALAGSGNADLINTMGPQLQMQSIAQKQAQADRSDERNFMLKRDSIQNEYGTARDVLNRAHAMALQDNSAANQATLQAAQQRFTAAESAATRSHQGAMQAGQQTFAAGESALNRGAASAENALNRGAAAAEGAANRNTQLQIHDPAIKANAEAAKKAVGAKSVLSMLDEVEPMISDGKGGMVPDLKNSLIEKATGSTIGAAGDWLAGTVGAATEGAKATASLKTIQAALMLNMPRMEGPQSDKDTALYREAVGQIGDPSTPREVKRAAVQTVRRLQQQYLQPASPSAPAAAPPADNGWSITPVAKAG